MGQKSSQKPTQPVEVAGAPNDFLTHCTMPDWDFNFVIVLFALKQTDLLIVLRMSFFFF